MWALVAGLSRSGVQNLFHTISRIGGEHPTSIEWIKAVFVSAGVAIDIVGLVWLALSLFLVVFSSRQHFSISWAWVSAICQAFVAAFGAVWVILAVQEPYDVMVSKLMHTSGTLSSYDAPAQVGGFSLAAALTAAVVVWIGFTVWLVVENSRWTRHKLTLRDGLRSNVYR